MGIQKLDIKIELDRRKSGKIDGAYPIVINISNNGKRKRARIGHFSKPSEWNAHLGLPNKKHKDYYTLLDKIHAYRERITKILSEANRKNLSAQEIKAKIFNFDTECFYDWCVANLPNDDNDTRVCAIKAFNELFPEKLFDEITQKHVFEFRDHRLKKYKPSGVDSYLRSLRALWNRSGRNDNPFIGVNVAIPEKVNRVATTDDLKKMVVADLPKKHLAIGGHRNFLNYWLLMFYLGGIDPEVLTKLRYDEHLINGRVVFNRDKGGSKKLCNNIIPQEAWVILAQYDCKPFFVPIFQTKNHKGFMRNFANRMPEVCKKLGLSVALKPKSARYTFIDRAEKMLIDERVVAQIVGHKRRSTTSLYSNAFPARMQDKFHMQIIDLDEEMYDSSSI